MRYSFVLRPLHRGRGGLVHGDGNQRPRFEQERIGDHHHPPVTWRGLGETDGLIWQAVGLTRVPLPILEAVT